MSASVFASQCFEEFQNQEPETVQSQPYHSHTTEQSAQESLEESIQTQPYYKQSNNSQSLEESIQTQPYYKQSNNSQSYEEYQKQDRETQAKFRAWIWEPDLSSHSIPSSQNQKPETPQKLKKIQAQDQRIHKKPKTTLSQTTKKPEVSWWLQPVPATPWLQKLRDRPLR